MLDRLWQHIQKEWGVLKQAPIAFAVLVALAFGLAFAFVSYMHNERFASLEQQVKTAKEETDGANSKNDLLKERLEAKDDQLTDYRARLLSQNAPASNPTAKTDQRRQQLSQSATRFSGASNEELRNMGIAQAHLIRSVAQKPLDVLNKQGSNDQFKIAVSDAMFEYQNKYQADAIVLRDEMISRLARPLQRPSWVDTEYSMANNPLVLQDVAADLEVLAKKLPK